MELVSKRNCLDARGLRRRCVLQRGIVALCLVLSVHPAGEAVAALRRSPQRTRARSTSLTWMPDVRERLRLLREHGNRTVERRLQERIDDPTRAGQTPPLPSLREGR